jgi:hypothetical protein
MKIQKFDSVSAPDYPNRRQFAECKALLGAAVIGLGGVVLAADAPMPLGGKMMVEPRPEAPAKPETPAPAVKDYVVQKGDTLYGIAQKQLGAGKRWPEIIQANPGLTEKNLKPGQTIKIPAAVAPVEPPRLGGVMAPPPAK